MNALLICIIVMTIVLIIIGYIKGLIKTTVTVGILLFSVVVSLGLHQYISKGICKYTSVDEKIKESISESMSLENINNKTRTEQIEIIDKLHLPETVKNELISNNNKDIYDALHISEFGEYIGSYLSYIIINVISFIATQIFLIILSVIVIKTTDLICEVPVIKEINKAGGGIMGAAGALLLTWIFFIVSLGLNNLSIGIKINEMICESKILSFLYDNNLLLKYILSIYKIIF